MKKIDLNYSLLDGAKLDSALHQAKNFNDQHEALYADPMLAPYGPFVFRYAQPTEFSSWLDGEGGGQNWGIFVQSSLSLQDLSNHFRSFTVMRMEQDGVMKEYFRRFQDPRVFRQTDVIFDAETLKDFMQPLQYVWMEDEDPSFATLYTFSNGQLHLERLPKSEFEIKTPIWVESPKPEAAPEPQTEAEVCKRISEVLLKMTGGSQAAADQMLGSIKAGYAALPTDARLESLKQYLAAISS